MKYYGIKTPKSEAEESYIWWISDSSHNSWMMFFEYPNKKGQRIPYRLCISDAIRAYEAIGYKCVELSIEEMS